MSYIQLPIQVIPRKIVMPNLEIFYPFIISGTNSTAVHKINRQIYNLVNKLIVEQGYFQSPYDTQVIGTFELKSNQRDVFSVSITNYTYPYHAAHGMTVIKSLTFDIKSGKVYQLHELFKPGSNYIKKLSEIIEMQIKERDIPLLEGFKDIKPNQDYYIADKALVIYYQLYELAAYVYGLIHFPISVYEIQDLIKEDSPLGVMLGSN